MFFKKARRIKDLEEALARQDETTNQIINEVTDDMQARQDKAISALKERYAEDLMDALKKVKVAFKEDYEEKISALEKDHAIAITSLQGKLRDQTEADALLSAVHLIAEVVRSRGMESRTDKERIAELEKKLEENAKNWRAQVEEMRTGLGVLGQEAAARQGGIPFGFGGFLGASLGAALGTRWE